MKRVGLLLVLLTLAIGPAQAQVGDPISGFDPRSMEIDGNVGYDATCQICVFGNPPSCFTSSPCTDWLVRQSMGLPHLSDPIGNADTSILSPDSIYNSGSTLPKQDIYRIWLANNLEYLFLAEERRSNNGNSGWHVFMTKIAPTVVPGQPVVFHLVPNDLEIRICFPKGNRPQDAAILTRQVPLGTSPTDVLAQNIWSSGLFADVAAVAGFMVNVDTVPALAGALDSHGDPASTYEPATFAEAAIRLSRLGIAPCGTKLFVTVITRSSCQLTSDLKDIAGPTQYNFGGPKLVVAPPIVGCTTSVHFKATASKGTKPYVFRWYDNGSVTPFRTSPSIDAEPAVDEFDYSLPAGTHKVRVVVTDSSDCSDAVDIPQFANYNPLGLTCNVTMPDCGNKSTLSATASGGSGSYKYEWFDNGSPIGGNNASFDYTFPNPSVPTVHTIKVVITDVGRADSVICTKDCQKTITVYKILDGTLTAGSVTCGVFTWTATPLGGKSPYTYVWKLDGSVIPGQTGPTLSYGPKTDCADHEVCVIISDSRDPQCTKTICKKVHQEITTTFPP